MLSNYFFKVFPEHSLLNKVSKDAIKKIGHHALKTDMMGQLYPIIRSLYTEFCEEQLLKCNAILVNHLKCQIADQLILG